MDLILSFMLVIIIVLLVVGFSSMEERLDKIILAIKENTRSIEEKK